MNIIKVLWQLFQHCFGRFTMLLVKRSSEPGLLHIFLTTFSDSVISKIRNLWRSSFCSKDLKFNLDFKNPAKTWEKVFCFWDNCIWISLSKLSLLSTGYFSSADNVLTSSPKIFHVSKRDFFNSIGLAMIIDYYKGAVV